MAEKINDGGPAFPVGSDLGPASNIVDGGYGGMTLRDYFAARVAPTVWGYSSKFTLPVSQAAITACDGDPEKLAACMKNAAIADFNTSMDDLIARESYRIADAMMKARNPNG